MALDPCSARHSGLGGFLTIEGKKHTSMWNGPLDGVDSSARSWKLPAWLFLSRTSPQKPRRSRRRAAARITDELRRDSIEKNSSAKFSHPQSARAEFGLLMWRVRLLHPAWLIATCNTSSELLETATTLSCASLCQSCLATGQMERAHRLLHLATSQPKGLP